MLVLLPQVPLLVNSVLVVCVFLFCQRLMHFAQYTITQYTIHTHSNTNNTTDTAAPTQLRTPTLTV